MTTWRVKRDRFTEALAPGFDGNGKHPDAEPAAHAALSDLDWNCVPSEYSIGVVLGPSGSGKTFVLDHLCHSKPRWSAPSFPSDMAVCSHEGLQDAEGGETKAAQLLDAAGLNDIPSRLKPFHVLSNGERSRVLMALQASHSGAVLDDFAAVVHDQAARSMATCLARSVRQLGLRNVLVATTKSACVPFLQPDFVIDTERGVLHTNPHTMEERRTVVQIEAPDISFKGNRMMLDSKSPLGWHGPVDNLVLPQTKAPEEYGAGDRQAQEVPDVTESYARSVRVKVDETAAAVANAFEFEFTGKITTKVQRIRNLTMGPFGDFRLGVLVGPSGCGKTTQLKRFGRQKHLQWRKDHSVATHIGESCADKPELLAELLDAVALPVATALRPFCKLSSSERHRAEIARYLLTGGPIDEFTSCLDRATAQRVCLGVADFVRRRGSPDPVVVATVHEDVVPALFADWVFYVKTGTVISFDGDGPTAESIAKHAPAGNSVRPDVQSLFQPPTIRLQLVLLSPESLRRVWESHFKEHHYLNSKLTKTLGSFGLVARSLDGNGEPLAFHAIANSPGMPPLSAPLAFREHRLVVLPEWQGFGIGPRISNLVGELILAGGFRFFSKTAHPRLGAARAGSSLWKPTSGHLLPRKTWNPGSNLSSSFKMMRPSTTRKTEKQDARKNKIRLCYSHQFLGQCGHGNNNRKDPTRWLFKTPRKRPPGQDGADAAGRVSDEDLLRFAKFCETCQVLVYHSEVHQSRFGTHNMRDLSEEEKTMHWKKSHHKRVGDLLMKRSPQEPAADAGESKECSHDRPLKSLKTEPGTPKSIATVSAAAAVLSAAANGNEDELRKAQEHLEVHHLLDEVLPPPAAADADTSTNSATLADQAVEHEPDGENEEEAVPVLSDSVGAEDSQGSGPDCYEAISDEVELAEEQESWHSVAEGQMDVESGPVSLDSEGQGESQGSGHSSGVLGPDSGEEATEDAVQPGLMPQHQGRPKRPRRKSNGHGPRLHAKRRFVSQKK